MSGGPGPASWDDLLVKIKGIAALAAEEALRKYIPLLDAQVVKITQREINERIAHAETLHIEAASIEKSLGVVKGKLPRTLLQGAESIPPGPASPRPFLNLSGQVEESVKRALANLPEDKTIAVVAHGTAAGASLSVVAKLGSEWSVVAEAYKPWHGPLTGYAEVRWSR